MTQFDISFFSNALLHTQRLRVMMPDADIAIPQGGFPVLYLFHGFTDNCDSFLHNSSLQRYCIGLPLCIVMPNAENSFYTDMRCGNAYWTHISQEIPQFIKNTFPVNVSKNTTYVGGISMGGYGAIKWMLRAMPCQEVFLLSPVTDIVSVARNGFDTKHCASVFTKEQLGLGDIFDLNTLENSENDLLFVLRKQKKPYANVHIYCGTKDFLYADVLSFCELLRQKKANFSYKESDGTHCWATWEQSLADVINVLRGSLS